MECASTFESYEELRTHLMCNHGRPRYVHCKFCDAAFMTMLDLNIHTASNHANDEHKEHARESQHGSVTPIYQASSKADQSLDLIDAPLSPINQLDGGLDDTELSDDQSDSALCVVTSGDQGQPAPFVQQAPYFLNRQKQSNKICTDAARDDIEVTINNNDTNVNIQCSSGFYLVVARPCISSFSKGATCQFNGLQVVCKDDFIQVDKSGASDFSRLAFDLKDTDQQKSLGKVTVHLRHTTRLVQVQGAAKMADGSTTAVWFAEHFLSQRFQELATIRQFDISAFNQGILEVSRNHHVSIKSAKYCAQCSKMFSPSSKPIQCPSCLRKIHTMCMKMHLSSCANSVDVADARPHKRTRTSTSSTASSPITSSVHSSIANPPAMAALPAGLATGGVATFTGGRASITFVPHVSSFSSPAVNNLVTTSTTTFVPNNLVVQSELSSAANMAPASSIFSATITPGQNATPGSSSAPTTASATITTTATTRAAPKKTASAKRASKPAVSPADEQVAYLTTELTFAHTRIVAQDNTIKDLELKVNILKESLKTAEEKLNSDLHMKYFGSAPPHINTGFGLPSVSPHCHPQYHLSACPSLQQCSCSSYNLLRADNVTCALPSQSRQNSEKICKNDLVASNVKTEIDAIKIDILDIKTKLDSLLVSPAGKPNNYCPPTTVALSETIDVVAEAVNVDGADIVLNVSTTSTDEEMEIQPSNPSN